MDSGKHTPYLEKYNRRDVQDFELFKVPAWEIGPGDATLTMTMVTDLSRQS